MHESGDTIFYTSSNSTFFFEYCYGIFTENNKSYKSFDSYF